MKRLISALVMMTVSSPVLAAPTYDQMANCIADRMRATPYHVFPLVYAPPVRHAKVMLWVRGTEWGGEPVATFTISVSHDSMWIDMQADDNFPGLVAGQNAMKYCREILR